MIPACTHHTPYRGGVSGIFRQVTTTRLTTSNAISSFSGQALKNSRSVLSNQSLTPGHWSTPVDRNHCRPDPAARYRAIRAISVIPSGTLLNRRNGL